MDHQTGRDLTSLEYIVMGLIGMEPQSGYGIINYFEAGQFSWSASPGSIYPMLKRLEKSGMIAGEMDEASETRQRKIYRLTPEGERLLDAWLREIPKMRPFYEQRELAMLKFQFMETRFNVEDTLTWLNGYLDTVRVTDYHSQLYQQATLDALKEIGKSSVHRQLLVEATMMELNTLRTWLDMAKARLTAVGIQTGEFKVLRVKD